VARRFLLHIFNYRLRLVFWGGRLVIFLGRRILHRLRYETVNARNHFILNIRNSSAITPNVTYPRSFAQRDRCSIGQVELKCLECIKIRMQVYILNRIIVQVDCCWPPAFLSDFQRKLGIFRLENGLVTREVTPELIEEVFLVSEPVSYALDHFHFVIDAL